MQVRLHSSCLHRWGHVPEARRELRGALIVTVAEADVPGTRSVDPDAGVGDHQRVQLLTAIVGQDRERVFVLLGEKRGHIEQPCDVGISRGGRGDDAAAVGMR